MFIVLKKKSLGILFAGLLMLGISFGVANYAIHPNMKNWKNEKLVITDVKTEQKVACLTFDDGPDPTNTPAVLDSLKKHNTHATFFVVGNRAESSPSILQRMAKEGHEIGNHSLSHADFNHKDKDFLRNEIKKANEIIERLSGQNVVLFRPPGGYLSYDLVEMTQQEKVVIAYWTYQQDSKDWKNGMKAAKIAAHIVKYIKPGQIIILHDGSSNGLETAKAVDILIPQLRSQGYRLVTMGELIKLGNKE
ncbi:MAG: polysaccharide deacetylase family protein [Syntrophomonas sp.]